MNAAIVLHETAHAISDWILGLELAAHGPEWLGIYMVLLEEFRIASREALHASAVAAKLEFRPRNMVGPSVIRKRYKKKAREIRSWHRTGWPI